MLQVYFLPSHLDLHSSCLLIAFKLLDQCAFCKHFCLQTFTSISTVTWRSLTLKSQVFPILLRTYSAHGTSIHKCMRLMIDSVSTELSQIKFWSKLFKQDVHLLLFWDTTLLNWLLVNYLGRYSRAHSDLRLHRQLQLPFSLTIH